MVKKQPTVKKKANWKKMEPMTRKRHLLRRLVGLTVHGVRRDVVHLNGRHCWDAHQHVHQADAHLHPCTINLTMRAVLETFRAVLSLLVGGMDAQAMFCLHE
jgi:hypothetical protein